ncbi:disease resistance protein RPV1-like isoform X2 [Quercus robur]|uniref:disease resistance protein RPV1-like isoform X2 n=1 Tax=Quercus robur TaxID=38942 RepID=UPI002163BA5B|nr:disease resistance protein RPV1-like isoform X2 [Quercus robur]
MVILTEEGASSSSSSSSSIHRWNYDVFLSFRGEETRNNFTSHLYEALREKGFNTFIDNDLQKGEEISMELLKTIELSKILIVVFSKNFASSTWCLNELVKIFECKNKNNGQKVLPIFYKVDPSEIRKQDGEYGTALVEHEEKFKDDIEKVQTWRKTLTEAANLSGFHYNDSRLSMHDLLQQMGREIVQQESEELQQRSRIWRYEDAHELLTGNMGSNKIRGIMLCSPKPTKIALEANVFKRMKNLKFLIGNVQIGEALEYLPDELRVLEWHEFPLSLSSKCCLPRQLVVLKMSKSNIILENVIKQGLQYEYLKMISLRSCEFITKLPDLCCPNLEKLDLDDCKNLIEVHESIGFLEKLKVWRLGGCSQLQILPSTLMLKSLKYFSLTSCKRLEKFPDIHPEMNCLWQLDLRWSGIRELPSSLLYLTRLEELSLNGSKLRNFLVGANKSQMREEEDIPSAKLRLACNSFNYFSGPTGFQNVTFLYLSRCPGIKDGLDSWMQPDYFPALKYLCLSETGIVTIPESISRFTTLEDLEIKDCKELREIPRLPQSIGNVDAQNCYRLDTQSSSRLLNQFREILGILPNTVAEAATCFGSERPQIGMVYHLTLPVTEIPTWLKFNHHQSVGNSVSFLVGPKISNLVVCIAIPSKDVGNDIVYMWEVDFFINGKWQFTEYMWWANGNYEPTEVALKANVFKRMKNLKFLIGNVHIGEDLEYLPDELRFLEWHEFPLSLSSKCCVPEELVALKMSKSNIILEKVFKQGFQYENLKMINLRSCEFITKLPDLCCPNLEKLDLQDCKNLIRVHESIGFLEKLKVWTLRGCSQLQILPNTLMLKSLGYFDLNNCSRLEKFSDIHPEMKCLKKLFLGHSGIRELPSSLLYLTELDTLELPCCRKLTKFLVIPSAELRPACNSFNNFLGPTGYLSLTKLDLTGCVRIKVELDSWMQADYFPILTDLVLDSTSIVTIPESISRFTRLQYLSIRYCRKLREIPRLPKSIRTVVALYCYRLDPQSSSRLWNQFGEILGILPNTVAEAARSFESKIHCLVLPAIEIPRWFKFNHHQSVGDSVSFLVGPKFSNLVVCIAFPSKDENSNMENHCFIDISINGVKQPFMDFVNYDHVWLIYGKVNISNPSEENRIKVEVRQMVQIRSKNTMRIYVECICCPASSMDQWAFNNREEDSGHVGIRHRLQRRNHRSTHARHPQKHYLSRFGWLRIRFQLWKRSSKPWRQ